METAPASVASAAMASASTSADAGLVCAYYCEVGVRERLVAARHNSPDAAAEGLTALLRTAFDPAVLLRLPEQNRPGELNFTPEVAMFCFPVPAESRSERA